MGTAIKHPVPDRVLPSFVIFDIRALWHSARWTPVQNLLLLLLLLLLWWRRDDDRKRWCLKQRGQ